MRRQERGADAILWVGARRPHRGCVKAGSRLDQNGFALVDTPAQRDACLLACIRRRATLAGAPHPKSGVYAIRHAPVLEHNLRATLAGGTLERYVAQTQALALISTGRKYCLATRGDWALEGAWLWRVKDWIDRRWIKRFAERRFRANSSVSPLRPLSSRVG